MTIATSWWRGVNCLLTLLINRLSTLRLADDLTVNAVNRRVVFRQGSHEQAQPSLNFLRKIQTDSLM